MSRIGSTLLHQVCVGDSARLMDTLLSDFNLVPSLLINDRGDALIHTAALNGNIPSLKLLVDKYKCFVDSTNKSGLTALHIASSQGHTETCKVLIKECGADVNIKDREGNSPLNHAINSENPETVYVLSKHLCKANISGCESKPLLHQLCGGGFVDMLQKLCSMFNCHDSDFSSTDEDGNTVLHIAALFGRENVARLLLCNYKQHIQIDHTNSQGHTALYCACVGGFTGIARLLVSHKASIDIMDNDGYTPLKKASSIGNAAVVHGVVRECGYIFDEVDFSLLHQVCAAGDTEILDVLLTDVEWDPSSVRESTNKNTLLHTAVVNGNTETIRLLVNKYSCPVDSININRQTPLHLVCSSTPKDQAEDVVNMLVLEFKANVSSRDNDDNPPIALAVQTGHTKLMDYFIKQGISPTITGYKNRTLLHIACAKDHDSLAKALIEKFHLSPYSGDVDGNTALHLSALYGQIKCLTFLLFDQNVPIFLRNKSGRTAEDLTKDIRVKQMFTAYRQSEGNKIQKEYEDLQLLSMQKYSGVQTITRVFVMGNTGSGKSTLIQSLKQKGLSQFFQVSEDDVRPCTPGIIPIPHTSRGAEIRLYYDFAGHKEYYSSHAAILEHVSHSSCGSSVYLVVSNLSKEESSICDEISYWLSFVSYHAHVLDQQHKLKVAIVLSHFDIIKDDSQRKISDVERFLARHSHEVSGDILEFVGQRVFPVNCRHPRSSRIVDNILQDMSKRTTPCRLSLEAKFLYGILKKDFDKVVACKFNDLIDHINVTNVRLPLVPRILYPIVKELHDIGELMIIGSNEDHLEDFLLLLDVSKLTTETHELLFSDSAKQTLASKTNEQFASMGILPEDYLQSILPEHITKRCLIQLQYCQEFSLAEIASDYSIIHSDSSTNSLLYFPALCSLSNEQVNWSKDTTLPFSFGWYAKSKGKFQCFPPRFLHVLLLRLAFSFALPIASCHKSEVFASIQAHNRRCTMWNNGICWLVCEGVECVVEVVNESKGVVCIARSREKHAYECIHMLTLVIDEVIKAKVEFCQSISLETYYMNASSPSSYINGDNLFLMSEIESGLENEQNVAVNINGHQSLDLEDLRSIGSHRHWGELNNVENNLMKVLFLILYVDFYFFIKISTILSYIEEVVIEWEALGMALGLPYHLISEINLGKHTIESKRTEMIRKWMNSSKKKVPVCWWVLVKALEEKSVNMNVAAAKIKAEQSI